MKKEIGGYLELEEPAGQNIIQISAVNTRKNSPFCGSRAHGSEKSTCHFPLQILYSQYM